MESRPALLTRPHGLPGLLKDEPPSPREQLTAKAKIAFGAAEKNTKTWHCCFWVLRCITELCDDNEQNVDYWQRQLAFVTTQQPVKKVVDGKIVTATDGDGKVVTEMPSVGLWASQLSPYARQSFQELISAAGSYDDSLRLLNATSNKTTTGHRAA